MRGTGNPLVPEEWRKNMRKIKPNEGTVTTETVTVKNLRTLRENTYVGLSPQDAVVAAYAQEKGDFNHASYLEKYAPSVELGSRVVALGDWCAMR